MRISLRYFAAARELTGVETESIELTSTLRVTELLGVIAERHPRMRGYVQRMRAATNGAFAAPDDLVRDGDEVVILPPVAGGSALVDVRATPLSVDECVRAVSHAGAGGVAIFLGIVRDHADGKPVARLDYEAYDELAIAETRRICDEIEREIAGARVAVVHRVGELHVGDVAVVVAASAPHRGEAFAACRAAIDRVKESVPIWKKEWGPDGTAHWVNLEPPDQ
jgi:molybdopterin synthase catalytic subunit